MIFKHFLNCTSHDDAKKRYRQLAIQHHPDKGGNEAIFKEVAGEYQKISRDATLSFPLTNRRTTLNDIFDVFTSADVFTGADAFKDMADHFNKQAWKERRRPHEGEGYTTAEDEWRKQREKARETAEKQRAKRAEQATRKEQFNSTEEMWKEFSRVEQITWALDDLIEFSFENNKKIDWMLMEIYKLDNLNLQHFKYVKWKLNKIAEKYNEAAKFNDDWVATAYKNYVSIKSMKWEF